MSALNAISVLEITAGVSGEYCGKLLADFGAQVIKLELPELGSPTRHMGPFLGAEQRDGDVERSGLFAYLNTNKQSVALDWQAEEGGAKLKALLSQVNAVISDLPHSVLQKNGLDASTIERDYPGLVFCSISPYGATETPELEPAAIDLNVMNASGWAYHSPTGADPSKPPLQGPGRFLPSYESGVEAAMCITASLYDQASTGQGEYIDISMQAVLASRIDYVLGQMITGDLPVSTDRTAYDLAGPAGIFPCKDGFVYTWMSAPGHWEGLRKLLANPAWMDDDFPDNWLERACTDERVAMVRKHLGEWLLGQNKVEAVEQAQTLGLIMVQVNNTPDLQESPQYKFRQFFNELEHPVLGKAVYPGVPYRLSETPAELTAPAPLLGQHSEQVLQAVAEQSLNAQKTMEKPEQPSRDLKSRGGPLQGIRVVELTKVWAGPYVGKQLSFLGAEVIRVESLGSLDVTRFFGVDDINNAPGFKSVNPQKLSVQIDMKTEQGIKVLLDLLAEADVVVENLRPGAIDRLGLGYDVVKGVNPNIIYVSMGMYGHDGPLAYQTGYAPCFAALGGISALVGYEGESPAGLNLRYADSTFGTVAAYAAMVALMHRRFTGHGQFIDVSAVETITSMIGDTIMNYSLNGVIDNCIGNRHPEMAPHGVYPCQNGEWLALAVTDNAVWQKLVARIGLADSSKFNTPAERKQHEAELDTLIADWTRGQDATELAELLQAQGIAANKSLSSIDLVADASLWMRGFYQEVHDQTGQSRSILGPSWKMTHMAAITDDAPALGEHNHYILGEVLGLSEERQQALVDAGVVR